MTCKHKRRAWKLRRDAEKLFFCDGRVFAPIGRAKIWWRTRQAWPFVTGAANPGETQLVQRAFAQRQLQQRVTHSYVSMATDQQECARPVAKRNDLSSANYHVQSQDAFVTRPHVPHIVDNTVNAQNTDTCQYPERHSISACRLWIPRRHYLAQCEQA